MTNQGYKAAQKQILAFYIKQQLKLLIFLRTNIIFETYKQKILKFIVTDFYLKQKEK